MIDKLKRSWLLKVNCSLSHLSIVPTFGLWLLSTQPLTPIQQGLSIFHILTRLQCTLLRALPRMDIA